MEEIRREGFNEKGELCNTVIDLFKKVRDGNRYVPEFDEVYGYLKDWKVIGIEYKKYFCWTQLPNNMYCIEYPQDVDWHTWVNEVKPKIEEWVSWVSKNVFNPKQMIFSTFTTDRVRMRIAVAKLDKLELPRDYSDEIFYNFIECYWTRKFVYNEFYYKYVLDIPF